MIHYFVLYEWSFAGQKGIKSTVISYDNIIDSSSAFKGALHDLNYQLHPSAENCILIIDFHII